MKRMCILSEMTKRMVSAFDAGITNGWDIAAVVGYKATNHPEYTAKHVHDRVRANGSGTGYRRVSEGRDTICLPKGLALYDECMNAPKPVEEPKAFDKPFTTASALRRPNPREPKARQAFSAEMAGRDLVITSADYRPSLFSTLSNSGGFDEYLVLNFYFADDPHQTPRWYQTQAQAIFAMFRGVPESKFPVTGKFIVVQTDDGYAAFKIV